MENDLVCAKKLTDSKFITETITEKRRKNWNKNGLAQNSGPFRSPWRQCSLEGETVDQRREGFAKQTGGLQAMSDGQKEVYGCLLYTSDAADE